MEPGDTNALHEGIVALLGAIVTASVFTLGFLSHRSHAALREAQRHLETGHGDKARREQHADGLMRSAQSWVILGVNLALAAGVAVVIFMFTETVEIGTEGWTTLLGFLLVEAAVLGLAVYDHFHVGRALNDAKAQAPSHEPVPAEQEADPPSEHRLSPDSPP